MVFGDEAGSAAEQIGGGLGALFQEAWERQHGEALYIESLDVKAALGGHYAGERLAVLARVRCLRAHPSCARTGAVLQPGQGEHGGGDG